MKYKSCVKCGKLRKEKRGRWESEIWLSPDGYCSVCNAKFKDRKRNQPAMLNWVKPIKTHNGKYNHLNKWGEKMTEFRIFHDTKREKGIKPSYSWNQLQESRKRKIDEWL